MDEFRFAHAWAFPLLIAAGWVIWKGRWRRRLPARLYGDVRLTRTGIRSWKVRLHPLPDTLRVAAWCLLVVALARPQAGTAQEVIRGEGIDIVFALDVSGSMAALDFQPLNRRGGERRDRGFRGRARVRPDRRGDLCARCVYAGSADA
ncbi:MAG: hypothetical protein HND48_11035 [Chloroflexi bacterium]|nr:hypothetical protein [Chloroflexota bacterium]